MRKISDRQIAARRAREWFALDRVVTCVGSKKALADHFNVSYQAVQGWYRNGVPFEHCAALETLSEGTVQCEELLENYRQLTERPFKRVASIFRAGAAPCIYVAGPMTGYPELNFPAFHAETRRLRAAGYQVINPAEVNVGPEPSWSDCMRADLRAMMRCSTICLLPGWRRSRGARLEFQVARGLGFQVIEAGATP